MRSFYKKSIIYLLIASFALNPLFSIIDFSKVKAANTASDVGEASTSNSLVSIPNQANFTYTSKVIYGSTCSSYKRPSDSDAYNELATLMQRYNSSGSLLTLGNIFSAPKDAPIIMSSKDKDALKSLYCASEVAPDYENDRQALYDDSTKDTQDSIKKAVASEKTAPSSSQRYNDAPSYLLYLQTGIGLNGQVAGTDKTKNAELFASLVSTAQKRIDNDKIKRIWGTIADNIRKGKVDSLPNLDTLACVLQEKNVNALQNELHTKPGDVADKIDGPKGFLNYGLIDIRVIKTLLYLVTPKNEGGAGHWRLKVNRILQDSAPSKESNATIEALNTSNSSATASNVACENGMTAADCGRQRNDQPNIEATDKNGDQYEGWLNDLADKEDKTLTEPNDSAHYTGQGVDISEVDDIRCTLVKKVRIGKSGKEKKPIRPIKLAWQTTDGWNKSGENSDFDMESMMRNAASDTVAQMLTTLNGGDATSYEGDLSRASLEDIIMLLGQSLIGYAVGTSNYSLKGYNLNETLQNLGSVYLADYLGLPREIFVGQGFNDIDEINYNIGRAAIEKRLGLPYGSLNSFNILDSEKQLAKHYAGGEGNLALGQNNNLEGTLLNIGQRKVEYEMGLEKGDLLELVNDSEISGEPLNDLVGRRVIEKELNLKKYSWPRTAVGYDGLDRYISGIRTETIKLNPGYIDSLLHLPPGTTDNFIHHTGGMADSTDFARKVSEIRLADTTAGLKYFALSNSLYQLPGPDKDHPDAADTWADALKGKKNALVTVGVYTLARLLVGSNRNQITPKLPDGKTLKTIGVNENDNGVITSKEISSDQFALYVVRDWLRRGITRLRDDACQKVNPAVDLNVKVDDNGRTIYTGDLTLPQSVENQPSRLCILYDTVSYNINYTDGTQTTDQVNTFTISGEDSHADIRLATQSIGLEDLDIYRLWGFDKADGRNVYQTIGSKLLYYGLANKTLGKDSKAKIDLLDINPQLTLKSSEVTFYVTRILKVVELTKRVSDEWDIVQTDLPDASEITDKINKIKADLQKIYSDSDSDIDKYQKITSATSEILLTLDDLRQNLMVLRQYLATQSTPAMKQKVGQVNKMIIDVNELIRTASEIIAGKEIPASDALTLDQIKIGANNANNQTDSGNGRRTTNKLSPLVLAGLIFGVLSGKIKPIDMFVELGAGMAEASLSLPANSLIYLLKNYEDRGITGKEALFQAIGQARIEEQFNMPRYYFQGSSIDEPDWSNYTTLQTWLPDKVTVNGKDYDYTVYKNLPGGLFETAVRVTRLMHDGENKYQTEFLQPARKNFWAEQQRLHGKTTILESKMDDIVDNIKQRGLNDPSRSPENDLLFRLGFPMGQYSALVNNSPSWVLAAARANAIDKLFSIPANSTKSAFTGQKDIASSSLSNKEKNLLTASNLNISKNMLGQYIQILNHELLPSEADQYGTGLTPDYIFNNPYAKQADASLTSCPITYNPTADKKFMVNETTIENNSFAYYDKKGRHSFQSWGEAQRYANDHVGDKIDDTLGFIAQQLTIVYNQSLVDSTGKLIGTPLNFTDVSSGLTDFVNDRSKSSIFNQTAINILKQNYNGGVIGPKTPDTFFIDNAFTVIAQQAGKPEIKDTLIELFTRETLKSPVVAYKEIIGQKEAEKILTYKLFDGLGLDINPDLFDAGDFYDILTGDYSSLFRLGTSFIDRALDLSPGSTLLIYTARTPENRKCALAQIGGAFLGGLVGLNYVPISGDINDFSGNIGAAKIEETLGLPRGSFRGTTIEELIDNLRPINFTLAFKIPIDGFLLASDLENPLTNIMGADQYARIKNASLLYQVQQAQKYLNGAAVLSTKANSGLTELDSILKTADLGILSRLRDTSLDQILQMPGPDDVQYYQVYKKELTDFFDQMLFMDNIFGLSRGDTYLLLTSRTTPDDYKTKVGGALATKIGVRLIITQVFGLEGSEATAATNLAWNIKNIFVCRGWMNGGVCYVGAGMGTQQDEYFHKWGFMYQNLDQLFGFHLDDKLSLPDGTVQKVLNDPANAFPVLMEIGARKLDSQLKLDSSKVFSFRGLTTYLSPNDPTVQGLSTYCHTQVYTGLGDSYDKELDTKIVGAENDLKTYRGGDAAEIKRLQDIRDALKRKRTDLNNAEQDCVRQKRADSANKKDLTPGSDYSNLCDNSGGDPLRCNSLWTGYGSRIWAWAQAAAVEKIHEGIANIKIKTGENCYPNPFIGGQICNDIMTNVGFDMPPKDIEAIIKRGDMRYLQVAGISFAANVAMVKIDQWLSCPDSEKSDDQCRKPLPAEFRISYDDIKFAIIGPDPSAYDDVAVYMADNNLNADGFNSAALTHGLPPGDGTFGGMANAAIDSTPNLNLTTDQQIRLYYHDGYGMPADYSSKGRVAAWQATFDGAEAWCQTNKGDMAFTDCVNQRKYDARIKLDNYTKNKSDIVTQTQKRATSGLQYKMMDAALWKLDPNVFPGFSEIMIGGTSAQRWAAINKYINNGFKNNQLLGIHFDLESRERMWLLVAKFAVDKYVTNDPKALATFIDNGGYRMLGDFIAAKSESWFGFKIDSNIAQGIVTGLASGDWGIRGALTLDSVIGGTNTHTVSVNGKDIQIPTLGGALVSFGVSKIFGWADKMLGVSAGTTFKVAKMGYDAYTAYQAYTAIRDASLEVINTAASHFDEAGNLIAGNIDGAIKEILANNTLRNAAIEKLGLAKNATDAQITAGLLDKKDVIYDIASDTTVAADKVFQAAKGVILQYAINLMVQKLLGKSIGNLESALGLVPGSLTSLISLAIYNFVAPMFGLAYVSALSWQIAIAMFILQNLFGVYKVEYWCDADGYYPKVGSPNYNLDISDLGVWGGNVSHTEQLNKVMKAKMVASAQYKAQRLIGDMLTMQYSTKYRDSNGDPIVPWQIMTGRGEDVKYWNNLVTTNLCQKIIGKDSTAIYQDGRSICSGNSRDGVWQNPQTVAWTHIGF